MDADGNIYNLQGEFVGETDGGNFEVDHDDWTIYWQNASILNIQIMINMVTQSQEMNWT